MIVRDLLPNEFFFMVDSRIKASPFYNDIQSYFFTFLQLHHDFNEKLIWCISYDDSGKQTRETVPCPVADTLLISLLIRFSAWFFVTCLKSCLLILKIWSPGWRLKNMLTSSSFYELWHNFFDLLFEWESQIFRPKVGHQIEFRARHWLNCQNCLRWDFWWIE